MTSLKELKNHLRQEALGRRDALDAGWRIEASLRRIEEHLATLPTSAPQSPGDRWKLPDTPLEAHDVNAASKLN